MNQVLLVTVFCSLHLSFESDPNLYAANMVSSAFTIRYNNTVNIIFSNQNFTKFRDCLCNTDLSPTNVVTIFLNQQNVAYVSIIECESNTNVKQISSNVECSIFYARTGSRPADFSINCKPSISDKVSDGVIKKDNRMCPNRCLTIQWVTDSHIDLLYDPQTPNKCETPLVPTTSTVNLSTITSIPHISSFLNSSSSKEETIDKALMSELEIIVVVSLVLLCFAVSFILGAKRVSLMKFCKGQKQLCINKINYIRQTTISISTEQAAIHEEDVKDTINPNFESIPLFELRINGSRGGTTTYPANESADSHLNGTEERVRSRDVNSFLDHIYAELDDTVAGANSNHYDDGYSERQSVIIELPIRNKIIPNGNSKQRYYEVERDEEQHVIVQDLTEERFIDGASVNLSEDGYEVPRYQHFNLGLENKKEKEILKYTLFGRRSFEKNVKLNEPSGKLAYFELEVNDLAGDVSEHQHVFPTRGTEYETAMSGDGYEVPVKRTCYPIQEHELENDNNGINCGTIPQSISDTINQSSNHFCHGSCEAIRQASTNIYSDASIDCNSSVIVLSLGEKHDKMETIKQRYYEVELEEGSNGFLKDVPEACCSGVIRSENISNDGYQLPQQKLINGSYAGGTKEILLENVYETIPHVASDS